MSDAATTPPSTTRLQKLWHDWRGFLLFIALMLVFRSAIGDWNQVPTGSMIPSILVGDRIVVDKLAYDVRIPFTLHRIARWREPERGEVVTFPSPVDERLFVKRIIGIPGDVVELYRNTLIINGKRATYRSLPAEDVAALPVEHKQLHRFLEESILGSSRLIMLNRTRVHNYDTMQAVRVPEGQYLMLGDNRDNSGDYRQIGFVSRERILGEATAIAFSLDYDNYYLPRMGRFFRALP